MTLELSREETQVSVKLSPPLSAMSRIKMARNIYNIATRSIVMVSSCIMCCRRTAIKVTSVTEMHYVMLILLLSQFTCLDEPVNEENNNNKSNQCPQWTVESYTQYMQPHANFSTATTSHAH